MKETFNLALCLDVLLEIRINGERINGLFHLVLINGVQLLGLKKTSRVV